MVLYCVGTDSQLRALPSRLMAGKISSKSAISTDKTRNTDTYSLHSQYPQHSCTMHILQLLRVPLCLSTNFPSMPGQLEPRRSQSMWCCSVQSNCRTYASISSRRPAPDIVVSNSSTKLGSGGQLQPSCASRLGP